MDKLEEYNIECMLINDNQAREDELIKEYERNSMDRLISEQVLIDTIKTWAVPLQISNFEAVQDIWVEEVCRLIKAIPSAEPKTGHWIEEDMFDGDVAYRCSECNELFWIEYGTPKDNGYNFCPKCGKRLVEPQERSE